MSRKIFIIGLFLLGLSVGGFAQRIVVDSTSTNKYLMTDRVKKEASKEVKTEDPSFGDRALSIGKGILNRLKARLNLENAAESIKGKKDKLLGKKEDEVQAKEEKKKEDEGG